MTTNETGEFSGRRRVAREVLVSVVESLLHAGRVPTASEVRLELKRRTYNGFNLTELGYKRFRDFLADAEASGSVTIDRDRPGDVSVSLPGFDAKAHVGNTPAIRPDLWRAFVDWSAKVARYFDIENDRVLMLPKDEAPMEPKRFQEIRQMINEKPECFVEIAPISTTFQIGWMSEFAEQIEDPRLKALLGAALAGDKPAKLFSAVLREVPHTQVLWRKELGRRVRAIVEQWRDNLASRAQIRIDRREEAEVVGGYPVRTRTSPGRSEIAELAALLASSEHGDSGAEALKRAVVANFLVGAPHSLAEHNTSVTLRARLHAAIDRMPLEELRAIQLPVGYLFEE